MSRSWYVVRVQVGREERVKASLEKKFREEGLEEASPRVIVPTEKISEIRGGKKTVRERKLYPGYIMVEMEMTDHLWYLVRETHGIGDFLGLKKPIPMPQHEVDKILNQTSSSENKPKIKIDLVPGEAVRIKDGPFENFDGVVETINASKGQVNVNITIFGRATSVELEYWQLEKV
ncbi:MAG: transcription termination/antitermination factor NusG [Planctomycetes bacterium RBG_16_59_8]|nr:MAG: transcription termination/antitermination factor NusG [Planctomycetes bacterium RBG_16_59_8]